jgi:hypothetical protein
MERLNIDSEQFIATAARMLDLFSTAIGTGGADDLFLIHRSTVAHADDLNHEALIFYRVHDPIAPDAQAVGHRSACKFSASTGPRVAREGFDGCEDPGDGFAFNAFEFLEGGRFPLNPIDTHLVPALP